VPPINQMRSGPPIDVNAAPSGGPYHTSRRTIARRRRLNVPGKEGAEDLPASSVSPRRKYADGAGNAHKRP